MRGDFMSQCNPGHKLDVTLFERDICSQCANPGCKRSRYQDGATQQKLQRHEELLKFKAPDESQPQSPLSVGPPADAPTPEPAADVAPAPTPPPPKRDPWAAPKRTPMDLYKEYTDPKKDPWSPQYEGVIDKAAKPGTTIQMPGKK